MKRVLSPLLAIFLLVPMLSAEPAQTIPDDAAIILNKNQTEYRIGLNLFLLEDRHGSLTIEDVSSGKKAGDFVRSRWVAPNPGFLDSVIWVKFTVRNPLNEHRGLYIEHMFPPMDTIDLYYIKDGGYHSRRAGDSVPYEGRDIIYRNVVFSIESAPRSEETFYMRFESSSSMNLDMSMWEHEAFIEKVDTEEYYLGAYYGMMFVMVSFYLFVFLSLRERTYLFYVAFIFFYSVFQLSLNGLGYKFFNAEALTWFNNSIPLFMVITTSFGLLFTRFFLRSAEFTPGFDRYMKALFGVNILCVFYTFFAEYHMAIKVSTLLISITIVSMTINGFLSLFRGYRSARFYALGWAAFLFGGLFQTFKAFGWVEVTFFTVWGQQIGSGMMVTFLALALADRINIMEREKSEATESLLKMQKEYSQTLEYTVSEKTEELRKERNILKNINNDMRRDIALAKKIQEQIIPAVAPREYIASFYRPMDEMGGDYFDYIDFVDSEKTGIFLSDVTGHGVPAAFITSMIKMILLQADERKDDPAGLLMHLNDLLIDHLADNFITAFYCVYDPADRSLVYANAGHNLPFIINEEGAHHPEGVSCIPVGIMSVAELGTHHKAYVNNRLLLDSGSKLLLYTDGLTEARSLENPSELFEDAGLMDILGKNRDLDCTEFIGELYHGLREFRKGDSFEDDVCVICVDIR